VPAKGLSNAPGIGLGADHVEVFAGERQRGSELRLVLGIEFSPKIGHMPANDDKRLACGIRLLEQS
jgi:hypothetical protein